MLKHIVAIALILFTFHGEWATWRNSEGEVLFFTPFVGVAILLLVGGYLWKKRQLTLGSKKVWIPLLIIYLAICLRILFEPNLKTLLECGFATALMSTYLIARALGLGIFKLFIPYAVVASIMVIVYTFLETDWNNYLSLVNGGYLNKWNYEATSAIIVFGTIIGLLIIRRRLWASVFCLIGCLGVIMTGSPQGVLCLTALVLAVLVRRDVSRYLIVLGMVLLVLLSMWFTIGPGQEQFQKTSLAWETVSEGALLDEEDEDYKWGKNRIPLYRETLRGVSIFGHGYSVYSESETGRKTVENVPLVVLDQVGILAALAWLFVAGWSLAKGNLKYIWISLIMLGMFDHTTWSILAPHWWAIVGITTCYTGKDWIFKGEKL